MNDVSTESQALHSLARTSAQKLVDDFPDFPESTAFAKPFAEHFCNSCNPTTPMELLTSEIALSSLQGTFSHTRQSLGLNRLMAHRLRR